MSKVQVTHRGHLRYMMIVFIGSISLLLFGQPPTTLAVLQSLTISASASATNQNNGTGQTASKAIDDVVDGHPGDYTKEWATIGQGVGDSLTLTWSSPVVVSRIVLYDRLNLTDQITAGTIILTGFTDTRSITVGSLANNGEGVLIAVSPALIVSYLTFRIDGVSASTVNAGLAEIRVFGSYVENSSLTAQATASTENAATQQTANKVIDGVVDGYQGNPGDYTKEWASIMQKTGAWIRLSWSSPQVINQIVFYDRPNLTDHVQGGIISFSDGSSVTVGSLWNNGGGYVVAFPSRTITSFTFTVTATSPGTSNIGLSEIVVSGGPAN